MKFREIKIGELKDFIESKLYLESHNIPITRQRAISQAQNPRADKDDVALIIAVDDTNQIVGYIGALPEKLYRNPEIKVTWNTGWWIDQEKGKQTAIPLFYRFLKAWDFNVMFVDMTERTKKIILSQNKFKIVKPLVGYKYFVRINTAKVLPSRYYFFNYLKPLLKLGDLFLNSAIITAYRLRLAFQSKINPDALGGEIEYCDTIDNEAEKFIGKLNKNELIRRGAKELNWILKDPWIIEKQTTTEMDKRYYFSSVSPIFKNYIVKIFSKEDKLISVLFLNNNDGLIRMPYAFFEKKDVGLVLQFLYRFFIKEKAISFISQNADITDAISQQKGNVFWHKKYLEREYVVSNTLLDYVDWDFDFQEGNGDMVFT